jgi:DNA recombination protein RmuC
MHYFRFEREDSEDVRACEEGLSTGSDVAWEAQCNRNGKTAQEGVLGGFSACRSRSDMPPSRSMETLLIILIVVTLGTVVWLATRVAKLGAPAPATDTQSFVLLQNQVAQLSKALEDRMGETHQAVRQSFAASTGVVRDVTEKLTRLEETNKQVLDITAQLQRLQDMLKNPKQRGILGEYYLETLLKNVLPPGGYQMQYKFQDGEIVDAAVFIKDKIVPVDSKFSLENYNRLAEEQAPVERERLEKLFINDLKLRVQETAKYIRPEEGTMEFAFMFIPHEAIYYELLVNKIGAVSGEDSENILQRAAARYHVIIVSPTSFLAYLQTVLQGLKALVIEEQAKDIKLRVTDLGRHLSAFEKNYNGVGRALDTVVSQYGLGYKEFQKIDKDVLRITGGGIGIEPIALSKPDRDLVE